VVERVFVRYALAGVGLILLMPIVTGKNAASQTALPQATLSVAKTTYLSSELVTGKLTIDNPTDSVLNYSTGAMWLKIRTDDGQPYDQPLYRSVSLSGIGSLPPGARRTIDVPLPVCDVLSDPCSEHVTLVLKARIGDRSTDLLTHEVSYTFKADPAATFRAYDISENRPIFITQAEAAGTVFQRTLNVSFQLPENQSWTPELQSEAGTIGSIFAKHGFSSGYSTSSHTGFLEVTMMVPGHIVDDAINAAVDEVRAALGKTLKGVVFEFAPIDADIRELFEGPDSRTSSQAQGLSDFFNSGKTRAAFGPGLGSNKAVQFQKSAGMSQTDFLPYAPYAWFGSSPQAARTSAQSVLKVRVRDTSAFSGDHSATEPPLNAHGLHGLEYLDGNGGRDIGLPLRATIAADRAEIFEVAQAVTGSTDAQGYSAPAVAVSLALERARALAAELGTTAGPTTLVATYTEPRTWNDSAIVFAGVAEAPTGRIDSVWQALLPTPNPSPSGQQVLPIPVAVRSPYTPAPQDTIPLYTVLAAVPEDATLISGHGDVAITASPSAYELVVTLDRRKPVRPRVPDPDSLVLAVLRDPHVRSAVVEDYGNGDHLPVYQIVIDGSDPSYVKAIAESFRRSYGDYAESRYDVTLMAKDCATLVLQAQKLSLQSALRDGLSRSQASGKTLRHLVLVAAETPTIEDYDLCGTVPAFDLSGDSVLRIDKSIVIHAPVSVIFRTY
jgi:hypothetical protein